MLHMNQHQSQIISTYFPGINLHIHTHTRAHTHTKLRPKTILFDSEELPVSWVIFRDTQLKWYVLSMKACEVLGSSVRSVHLEGITVWQLWWSLSLPWSYSPTSTLRGLLLLPAFLCNCSLHTLEPHPHCLRDLGRKLEGMRAEKLKSRDHHPGYILNALWAADVNRDDRASSCLSSLV